MKDCTILTHIAATARSRSMSYENFINKKELTMSYGEELAMSDMEDCFTEAVEFVVYNPNARWYPRRGLSKKVTDLSTKHIKNILKGHNARKFQLEVGMEAALCYQLHCRGMDREELENFTNSWMAGIVMEAIDEYKEERRKAE
ncbi:MAG: hypothetical protein SAJ12_06590 [Jaaginema sp. PMC 1079.18]|nr:hypothetical protein [Jaaginema sp. PMC 1080.18]MEC4850661.1 hypothetical protein [Jaaginema sp. PMC 1079.18]MEC4866671.1 hypothetical protein [Jaaginema sp. PMC 1078.18]